MACNTCNQTSLNGKKYVVDSTVKIGKAEVSKFPYWILLLAPLLLIPFLKKK